MGGGPLTSPARGAAKRGIRNGSGTGQRMRLAESPVVTDAGAAHPGAGARGAPEDIAGSRRAAKAPHRRIAERVVDVGARPGGDRNRDDGSEQLDPAVIAADLADTA